MSKDLEERVELSMLYDFYGALLRENQRRMFEASVLEDYNYAEIAESEGISRQGVYDAIKRATRQLRNYEENLGLVERFRQQNELVKELRAELRMMQISSQDPHGKRVFELLETILED